MSRPLKRGLDYFPLDTDTDNDSALAFIEAKHELVGYAVYVKLLQRIYGEEGYFMPWDEREQVIVARRMGIKPSLLAEIVGDCAAEGLFDKGLLERFCVLTSRGIQQRFITATARRADSTIQPELLLAETMVSERIPHAESTQRKEEEIEIEISPLSLSGVPDSVQGYFEDKIGRPATMPELRSLKSLVKNFGSVVTNTAIGQAVVQGHSPDSFGLVTTIAKAESA